MIDTGTLDSIRFSLVKMKLMFPHYRQPCVATQAADYVLLWFILFFFFFFFYSPFVLKNNKTDSHQIFRNCVFWCSLKNPIVLKFF